LGIPKVESGQLQLQLDQLKQKLTESEVEKDQLKAKLAFLREKSSPAELESKVIALEQENIDLTLRARLLTKANQTLTDQIDQHDRKKLELEKKLSDALFELKDKDFALNQLKQQNSELLLRQSKPSSRPPSSPGGPNVCFLRRSVDKTLTEAFLQTDDSKTVKSYYEAKVKQLNDKNFDLQSQLDSLQQIIDESTRGRKELSSKLSQSELTWKTDRRDLADQLETLKASYEAKLNAATETIRSLKAELAMYALNLNFSLDDHLLDFPFTVNLILCSD